MADSDTCAAAVKKCKALIAAMRAHPDSPMDLSQPSTWTSYNDFQKHGWKRNKSQEAIIYKEQVSVELKEVMQRHHVSQGETNNITACWEHAESTEHNASPFDRTTTNHEQFYNIAIGTIIETNVNSPAEDVKTSKEKFENAVLPSDYPVLQHWSDVTFLQWQELATSPAELQRVIHRQVSNDQTKAIIRDAFRHRGKIETRDVIDWLETYTEEDGGDFLALLGSPNWFGTAFMLAQHKKQLGWKLVNRIWVHWNEERILVLELEGPS